MPVAYSEIEPFPCAVLAHHYPDVPNWGDMTKFKEWPDAALDVLVGGTPCQSFSVAGLRAGLADPRGNLALTYLAIADRYRPRWVVWENVPGVLSADDGRALGAFLGGLAELGYGFAWRVLDAQYFGLAQRRKRVFVVGHLGDWRRAAAVLFDTESLRGDPAPRRETRQGTPAKSLSSSDGGIDREDRHTLIAGTLQSTHGNPQIDMPLVANPLTARMHKGVNTTCDEGQTMTPVAFKPSHFTRGKDGAPSELTPPLSADADKGDQDTLIAFSCKDSGSDAGNANAGGQVAVAYGLRNDAGRDGTAKTPSADAEGRVRLRDPGFNVYEEQAPTLDAGAPHSVAVAFDTTQITSKDNYPQPKPGDPCHPLAAGAHPPMIAFQSNLSNQAVHGEKPTLTANRATAIAFEPRFARNGRGAPDEIASPLKAESGRTGKGDGAPCVVAFDARQSDVIQYGDKTGPLDTDGHSMAVAFQGGSNQDQVVSPDGISPTLAFAGGTHGGHHQPKVMGAKVRRLTPRECCRLQGFSDSYLDITYRGKPAADGNKYKALGNSMAVPCMAFLGQRIAMVEDLLK